MAAAARLSDPKSARRGRAAVAVVALLALAGAAGGGAWYAKGRGYRAWVAHRYFGGPVPFARRPAVAASRPGHFDGSVPLDAFAAADVELPNDGHVIDAKTVRPDTVKLFRTADRREVPAAVNTSGGGDVIVLRPAEPLEPNTQYTFEVNAGVRDTAGAAFNYYASKFTTAAGAGTPAELPVAFEQVPLPAAGGEMFTSLAVGPDDRLYASTMDGRIMRFPVRPDGTLDAPATIPTIAAHNGGPRLVTGICFDPASTPQRPVLWVSHGQLVLNEATDWTGKISRLGGADLGEYQDYVVGLPRAVRDHLNNQPVFGPDGALYFCQASNTAMGAPDARWGMRPEHALTAAVLRLDVSGVARPPLDAKTGDGGAYDPAAPGAPLTVFATGVRNAYDLLWHTNGHLYAPMNASAAGGNTPGRDPNAGPCERPPPALVNVRRTLDDYLVRVERGGYYGHPNPLRGELVLNGGNPTAGEDPAEIPDYPAGTMPDRRWRPPAYTFGKNLSPTGAIEYRNGSAFGGLLRGRMLVCRYSGGDDVLVLSLGPGGEVAEALSGIEGLTRLMDPLDLVEDVATGNLYVAEFQPKRLTLLRPKAGGVSKRVYRQPGPPPPPAPQASVR